MSYPQQQPPWPVSSTPGSYAPPSPPVPGWSQPPAPAGYPPAPGTATYAYPPPAGFPSPSVAAPPHWNPAQAYGPPAVNWALAPATPARRLVAALIDLGITYGLITGFNLTFLAAIHSDAASTPAVNAIIGGWIAAVFIGYWVLPLGLGGGSTLGKRLTKIRVVRINGTPIELWRAALRVFVFFIFWLMPVLGVVNILGCTRNTQLQQCLHDRFLETYVIRRT